MKNSYSNSDEDEELKSGSVVTIELSAISQKAYQYINKIFSSTNSGNPFASPVGAIRGNMKNITNPENYPLGYFNLLETEVKTYTVE